MAFKISEFRSELVGDGARPNLFSVSLTFPTIATNGVAAGQKTTFMAKASQLPGSSLGTVPVFYFGREMKFAGNRTFPDWTIQVINDEDFIIRNALENWMNSINSHEGNKRKDTAKQNSQYTTDCDVIQYGKTGDKIKEYKFLNLFPIDIAPIDLDWGSNDTIEEYSVTFAYNYWTSNTTT